MARMQTHVLVCSQIPGLCAAVERAVAAAGVRVSLEQRSPEDLRRGGKHHAEWRAARVLLCDPGLVAGKSSKYVINHVCQRRERERDCEIKSLGPAVRTRRGQGADRGQSRPGQRQGT